MDRGFIPPESDEQDRWPTPESFMGEFGERDHPRLEVDATDPRIAIEPDTGDVRPM